MDHFAKLPEDCIAEIISFTSPVDASVFSVISKRFMTASKSDIVWNKFLPSDLEDIFSRSSSTIPPFSTKRGLYLTLSYSPFILDGGKLSFSLDIKTGKKCFMIAAAELRVDGVGGSSRLISLPMLRTRFTEVAVLDLSDMCNIFFKIPSEMLAEETHYSSKLVYNIISPREYYSCDFGLWREHRRWFELEVGTFFYSKGDLRGELESAVTVMPFLKHRVVIIQGVEVRPTGIVRREDCLDDNMHAFLEFN